MTSYLDRLNLKPNERRLVVFVGVVVFVVLNVWLVWPHYGDWNRTQRRLQKARKTLQMFKDELGQSPEYEKRVRSFEKDNPAATRDDQSIELLRIIQTKAGENRVNIMSMPRAANETKEFFIEQRQTVTVQATEESLVNFLYNLGAGESMIRVRELSLRPDAPHQQLGGNIQLVASYQRQLGAGPGPAAAAKPAAVEKQTTASKPATPPKPVAAPSTPSAKKPATSTAKKP